jgi:hypothetical protein
MGLAREDTGKQIETTAGHFRTMTYSEILGRRIAYFFAALIGAIGVFLVLTGFELFGRGSGHAPGWVIMLCGLAFLSAAGSMGLSILGGATARDGSLPDSAPFALRLAQTLLSLGIMVMLSSVASWVAFNPGSAGTGARFAFGAGAALCWLIFLGFAIRALRRLRG